MLNARKDMCSCRHMANTRSVQNSVRAKVAPTKKTRNARGPRMRSAVGCKGLLNVKSKSRLGVTAIKLAAELHPLTHQLLTRFPQTRRRASCFRGGCEKLGPSKWPRPRSTWANQTWAIFPLWTIVLNPNSTRANCVFDVGENHILSNT